METLSSVQLLNTYFRQHPLLADIRIRLKDSPVYVSGLHGSAFGLTLFSLFQEFGRDFLVLLNDREEAAYIYNEAQDILGDDRCEFLISGYKKSAVFGQVDEESALLRSEAIRKIIDPVRKPLFMVSYPEAILEKVPSVNAVESNSMVLHKGEKISMTFLIDLLRSYKFRQEDFVYEPGHFAVRGSIIDVFSYSNTKPYRIDFFGDMVESIRTFDIDSQVSDNFYDTIGLIPNLAVDTSLGEQIPLTQIIAKQTLVVFDDLRFISERLHALSRMAGEKKNSNPSLSERLADSELLISELCSFQSIIRSFSFDNEGVVFDTQPQPALSKNIDFFIDNISHLSERGYTVFIASEQSRQLERINAIIAQKHPALRVNYVLSNTHQGFVENVLKLCVYTDHQIFDRYQRYKIKLGFTRRENLTIQELTNINPGDYVVHIDHGIGQFGGLEKIIVNGKEQEAIKLVYKDNDTLYVNIHSLHKISKYKGKDSIPPKIHKLGSTVWQNTKTNAKKKIKDIARELISLYVERMQKPGYAFSPDTYLNEQLEASFIYEDTPDQELATQLVKADMEKNYPMDRLICGDVGFGKTEIAIRAAFKAVCDNKQVAVLVPTTILAFQHMKTFSERLKEFPVRIEYLSRMRSTSEQKKIISDLKNGLIDIIIGTHRITSDDIIFKDLGLLIIDEEQKFGVRTKEKIRAMKVNVDTLTLTATPIPRTLQFSLMGVRDLSIIRTPPPNRLPIVTQIHTFDSNLIAEAINYEVSRGGQVFFIHNRVQNIAEMENHIRKICPGVRTAHVHGQMDSNSLEKIMLDFIDEKYDVLVATTIIESGLDIPNANTIIINNAQNFGLSELHQLRGRVGRSNKKAFCYLLSPPLHTLPSDARRRLQAIEAFTELGSGFNIALQDLDIRGAGNLLGSEQSGFISELGYETYYQILQEAMFELREQEFKNLLGSRQQEHYSEQEFFSGDCSIETDLTLHFPDSYISNISERVRLYKQLDNIQNDHELDEFRRLLVDRFGKIPPESEELIRVIKLRKLARKVGLEKITIKQGKMIAYFISDPESQFFQTDTFGLILDTFQKHPTIGRIQEHSGRLRMIFDSIHTIQKAIKTLSIFCVQDQPAI